MILIITNSQFFLSYNYKKYSMPTKKIPFYRFLNQKIFKTSFNKDAKPDHNIDKSLNIIDDILQESKE